jgi:hypothetical protein
MSKKLKGGAKLPDLADYTDAKLGAEHKEIFDVSTAFSKYMCDRSPANAKLLYEALRSIYGGKSETVSDIGIEAAASDSSVSDKVPNLPEVDNKNVEPSESLVGGVRGRSTTRRTVSRKRT